MGLVASSAGAGAGFEYVGGVSFPGGGCSTGGGSGEAVLRLGRGIRGKRLRRTAGGGRVRNILFLIALLRRSQLLKPGKTRLITIPAAVRFSPMILSIGTFSAYDKSLVTPMLTGSDLVHLTLKD